MTAASDVPIRIAKFDSIPNLLLKKWFVAISIDAMMRDIVNYSFLGILKIFPVYLFADSADWRWPKNLRVILIREATFELFINL